MEVGEEGVPPMEEVGEGVAGLLPDWGEEVVGAGE